MNKQLLLTQFVAALATLRVGGHFVCKCFDLFTPFSAGLLYLFHTAFDDLCVYKPAQFSPISEGTQLLYEAIKRHNEPRVCQVSRRTPTQLQW